MTTYVLGAGASAHAGYPLARELGPSLQEWIKLGKMPNSDYEVHIDQLSGLYGTLENFEQILTELAERIPGSPSSQLEDVIRATIRQTILVSIPEFFNDLRNKPAPLYEQFARQRVQSGDVVLSFNYDVALERELRRAGLWEIVDGYGFPIEIDGISPSKVKMFKLHGSTNWLGMLLGGNTGSAQVAPNSLRYRPVIFGSREFDFLGYPREVCDPLCRGIHSTGGRRALILLTLRKQFSVQTSFGREWEGFWNCIWKEAEHALAISEEVVVIGYSMPNADERARELLLSKTNRGAAISIYCGRNSDRLVGEFRSHGFSRVGTPGKGFSDFLNQ